MCFPGLGPVVGLLLCLVASGTQAAPLRVCAVVLHSPYELEAIKAHLSADDFEFIELTPAGIAGGAQRGAAAASDGVPVEPLTRSEPGWLMSQCRPDLQCDIVVVSGEFAGGFFGDYGVSLGVQELEEAACQPQCRGIFQHPLEVFLLACNTLASKSADERTPDVYLNVLLSHGFSRAAAERVVELRYGPLGPSFRESVRRSFMGVPRIYGFASVAPLGQFTAPRLREYFGRTGDYARYLRRVGRSTAPNQALRAAFARTTLVQMPGLEADEPAAADRTQVCHLYDHTKPVLERLRIVRQLMGRPDFLAFVPTIEVFFNRNSPATMHGTEREILSEIQALQVPREQMLEVMYRLNVSAMKMQMAHLAVQLGWMSASEFHRLAVASAKQLLDEPLSTEVANTACEMAKHVPAGAELRSEDIPETVFSHAEGFRLLDCLAPADPRVTTRMLVGLTSIDEATRLWAAYALSHRLPLSDLALATLATRLQDPAPGMRERLRWIFETQQPLSPAVVAAIRERDPALAARVEPQPQRTP